MDKLKLLHYGAIYADPPWSYENYSEAGSHKNASSHYDCMSLDEIKKLPVGHLGAQDCALFLWVTDPFLPEGIEVMKAWGFQYKTVAFTWAKLTKKEKKYFMGLGYWTRANPEMCLLGVMGAPKKKSSGIRQLVVEPIREHSRKPDRIRADIMDLVDGPYLELFARTESPGWDTFGNQTNKFGEENNALS